MNRFKFVTLLSFLLIGCFTFLSGCGPKEDDDFFSDEALFDKDAPKQLTAQERIEQYKKILEIDPADYQIRNNLGVVYAQLNLFDEAVEQFKKSIEIKPDYTMAYLNIGALYGNMGRLDDSIAALQKAIEVKPDYAKAHQNLGVAYFQIKKYEKALKEFSEFIELSKQEADESLYFTMAECAKFLGDKSFAERYLKKVVELNPNHQLAKKKLEDIDAYLAEKDNQ